MPFDEFVEWALYDDDTGYYRQSKLRVGKSKNSDFYTSTSIKSFVWENFLIESCCKLLGKNDPRDFVFVEIAAEPRSNSLDQNLIRSRQSKPFVWENPFKFQIRQLSSPMNGWMLNLLKGFDLIHHASNGLK